MAHLPSITSSSLGAGCTSAKSGWRPAWQRQTPMCTALSRNGALQVVCCGLQQAGRQHQQQEPRTSSSISSSSGSLQRPLSGMAAATFIGAALLLVPVHPPPSAAAALEPANPAILGELRRLRQTEKRYAVPGTADPGAALAGRFAAVGDQLQRVRLLVQLQQFDSARMQLRQGAFANLRGDLRYEQDYRGVNAQVVSSVVQGVEQLDRKLRAKSPLAEVQPLLDALQQQLAAVVQADQQ